MQEIRPSKFKSFINFMGLVKSFDLNSLCFVSVNKLTGSRLIAVLGSLSNLRLISYTSSRRFRLLSVQAFQKVVKSWQVSLDHFFWICGVHWLRKHMKIEELTSSIKREEIVMPEFQREFVWNKARIRELVQSLLNSYPVGGILVWKTDNPPQLKDITLVLAFR